MAARHAAGAGGRPRRAVRRRFRPCRPRAPRGLRAPSHRGHRLGGLQPHRPRRLRRTRRRREQHARRAHRGDRRHGLDAADGDRAPRLRIRALAACRQVGALGVRPVAGRRRVRHDAGHRRHGPHRLGGGAPGAGLRDEDPLPQPQPRGERGRAGRAQGGARRAAARSRPRRAGAAVLGGDAPRDRGARAGRHEVDCDAGQHRAWRHRRRRGAGRRAARRPHRGGRPGRLRERAGPSPGAADGAQRRAHAARR